MKPFDLLLWLIFAALASSLLTLTIIDVVTYEKPLAVEETAYYFTTGDSPGFDLEADMLRLGQVAGHSSNTRAITVQHASATRVVAGMRGKGSDHISVDLREKPLRNGSATFYFTVRGSEALVEDEYKGTVVFSFYE